MPSAAAAASADSGRSSSNSLLGALPPLRLAERVQHLFARDRQRTNVGARSVSNRVRDILTVIGAIRKYPMYKKVHLVGTGDAGPWVILARALAGDEVTRSIADLNGFAFTHVTRMDDPMLLPGALKYGGIGGLAALGVPRETFIFGFETLPSEEFAGLAAVNKAAAQKWQEWEVPRELTAEHAEDRGGNGPDRASIQSLRTSASSAVNLIAEFWRLRRERQREIDAAIACRAHGVF